MRRLKAKFEEELWNAYRNAYFQISELADECSITLPESKMQILKLSFENINSLKGAWTIDFSSTGFPLRHFCDCRSGSGKTTILDAICLALYGHTPRIGSITQNANEVMNRDSDSCRSSLEFQTLSGRYRATWSQKRSRRILIRQANTARLFPQWKSSGTAAGSRLQKEVR